MIKTGILGGTFDPVHNGHLHIGKAALRSFGLDDLWFMPNGRPPHKNSGSITASVAQRLEMVRLSAACEEKFSLCGYEAERKSISYSYETMEHLKREYPDREFYFIIGGDSLDMIASWKCPGRLMRCCTILVAVRNEKTLSETQRQIDSVASEYAEYGADIRLLTVPEFPVSSSGIRRCIREGAPDDILLEYMPEPVVSYIRAHGLYR